MSDSKTNSVFTAPSSTAVITPRTYTDEQAEQIKALRDFAETVALPESDSYYVWEQRWLDKPDTMSRYMRAAKWRFDDAKKRLSATLEWRRDFKPDLIPPDEVKIESETGKIVLNGFDKDGRPVIYMRPGHENTKQSPRQLRHLVWCLERAKDFMPPGQDTIAIVVDYKSTTLRTNPSISTARKVLAILQQHYVETLGRGLVVNLPGILAFFYRGISPFMDPVTRDKIRFNPDLLELIPSEQLDADFGGEFQYEFEPESYWDQIVAHCKIAPDGTRLGDEQVGRVDTEKVPESLAVADETLAEDDAVRNSESSSMTAVQDDVPASGLAKLSLDDGQIVSERAGNTIEL